MLESELEQRASMISVWHQRRVYALIEIFEAFLAHLDFLRRNLYVPGTSRCLDPMWDFRVAVDQNIVFLDDGLQVQKQTFQSELLLFWNWALEQHATNDEERARAV